MYIIVGLGNPGREYAGTRHNIGFNVVTRIADDYNMSFNIKEHKALCAKGFIAGQKVLLAMPQTYMNLSGESVGALVNYYKINPEEELLIIYDDVSMDVGRLRLRKKGSAGGHNGIKSIISHLGTNVFPRMKVGVGAKPEGWDLADHVLARFNDEDNKKMRDVLGIGCEACKDFICFGIEEAMNRHNN
ncbi:MAG: aminoacyl-tRNA hydrolase [Lachnospiraceae bacterium]|nr:aminoacyl-tRNA hydrolase [Lachnospiraceae bacterium]